MLKRDYLWMWRLLSMQTNSGEDLVSGTKIFNRSYEFSCFWFQILVHIVSFAISVYIVIKEDRITVTKLPNGIPVRSRLAVDKGFLLPISIVYSILCKLSL